MPEYAVKPVDADPVALAILNETIEAFLEFSGNKVAREYLKAVATRVAIQPSSVVGIRQTDAERHTLAARAWLQQRLPIWLSRHG